MSRTNQSDQSSGQPNSSIETVDRQTVEVVTPSGQTIKLISAAEKVFYEKARDSYTDEYSFTMANDLRTLDRLLLLEVQNHRAQWFLAADADYQGVSLDAKEAIELSKVVKETEAQIHSIQTDMGLTKAQRDKASTANSVGEYIVNLQQRAKEFGIHREKQLGKALELINELFAVVGAYSRSNERERRKLGFESAEDIVKWVLEYMEPEYNAIDQAFRQNQKAWVRSL